MELKLKGAVKNVAKTQTKDALVSAYKSMFEKKAFKAAGDVAAEASAKADREDQLVTRTQKLSVSEDTPTEEPRYTKRVTKKGDGKNFPKKGETAVCFYTGTLPNGTVFDTNTKKTKRGKAPMPLRFKVGQNRVIRGWDEGIQTMSVGEKAELVIEPVWAYGKKGLDNKIPPNTTLHFDVELICIE